MTFPQNWQPSSITRQEWGHFQVVFTPPGGTPVDVTFFRKAPTQIISWSSGDPFGDAAAQIEFPQVTIFDKPGTGDLVWMVDYADVDIYYVAAEGSTQPSEKVWEGFVVTYEYDSNSAGTHMTATCVGALYQLDLYVRPPAYLTKPVRNEVLIKAEWDNRPHLRTGPCELIFPGGWTLKDGYNQWSGHKTRDTGSWDRCLTGYIQNLLSVMQTEDGRQWTMTKFDNRRPILYVRHRPELVIEWNMTAGQPGLEMNLSRDLTQVTNVIYGEGTDIAGTTWRNTKISNDGLKTTYDPVAFDPLAHGPTQDTTTTVRSESHYNFNVISQDDAIEAAEKILERDKDPGYFGTLKITADPEERSRFLFEAGHNIRIKHFLGTGVTGTAFHVAAVTVNIMDGSVELTVDTKARDLLTLQEMLMRNRDAKTPSRMLQINRESQKVEDTKFPWDYTAGSGYIPKASKDMWKTMPATATFPYTSQTTQFPPSTHPQYYLKVNANAGSRLARWSTAAIVAAQNGSIRLTEFAAYNASGQLLAVPFHVSFYKYNPDHGDFYPKDAAGPSPFLKEAFKADASSSLLFPSEALIVGWGDGDQKAGYSPGLQSEGDPVTGKLRDEGTWQFTQDDNALTVSSIYVAIYCEHTSPVYFQGRIYKGVD